MNDKQMYLKIFFIGDQTETFNFLEHNMSIEEMELFIKWFEEETGPMHVMKVKQRNIRYYIPRNSIKYVAYGELR